MNAYDTITRLLATVLLSASTLSAVPDLAPLQATYPAQYMHTHATTSDDTTLEHDSKNNTNQNFRPLLESPGTLGTEKTTPERIEADWPQPARFAATLYRHLLYQKLDVGLRTTNHKLEETDRGEPFDGSFIGSIDQLRLLPDKSPSSYLVVRYAPIPYVGIGYQTDQLVIRTQTSIPRERRISDRDTDGNLIIKGKMPFVFVRYNLLNWIEPYAEYGRAKYKNSFDPDPWWFADGHREFVVQDATSSRYWSIGLGLTIYRHIIIDIYTRNIEMDIDAIYYFRGDDREPEPFVFPASHRTHGITAAIRF